MIDLGAVYTATLAVTDSSGAATDPATATLTITLPDGTTTSPAVTLPPATTGLLTVDYATTQAGLHKASWSTTAPVVSMTDYFSVREFIALFSFDEAKSHLNITRALSDGGAELRRFMMASAELVESKVGPCVRRSVTDRVSDGVWQIALPRRPVLSVTSVTSVWPGGPSWTSAELITDLEAGVIAPSAPLMPFWWGPWDVVYSVGRADVPERFIHAGKEQLRHLWETQRGAQPPAVAAGEASFTTAAGWAFSVPRRVLELLEEDMVPSS